MFLQGLAARLTWCWFGTLLVAVGAIAAGKRWSPPVDQPAWAIGCVVAALVAGLLAAAVWSWARRQTALAAAVEIDRRFALKERVSSTLALDAQTRATEIGQALVRDAEGRLRRVDVAEGFRLRLDRRALLPLVPAAAAFALAALVPLHVPPAPAKTTTKVQQQTQQATQALVKRLSEKRKEAVAKGLEEAQEIAKLEEGVKKLAESQKNDRKQTLLALNDLVKDAQTRREELAGAADLKKQLAGLKNLQQGPAEKLGEAIKNGDFEKAAREIENLKQQLAAGKLEPEAQKKLAKQLDQLQQALAQKAEAHKKLVQDLKDQIAAQRQAGGDEQADKLQQQLDKLAAQAPQMNQLGDMAAQLKQAAECMGQGNCEQAAEALDQLGGQLAGMQENLQEMEALDAVLDEVAACKNGMACKACNGEGCEACRGGDEWKKTFGDLDRFAHRGGGKGIGVGLGPGLGDETNPDGKFYDSAVKQQPGRGSAKVVGEADGPNRKGRVQQEIQSEFAEADQSATDALSEQRLPHDYRDHAQKYFDALRGE